MIKAGRPPGLPTASAKHTGPYAAIEATYTALLAFVAEKGVTPESFMYEEYLNSPEDTTPDKLETNIYFPLKGLCPKKKRSAGVVPADRSCLTRTGIEPTT